jgi:hypothetical protein
MLIGFWVVHPILTHRHKICIQNEEENNEVKQGKKEI